jgi:hypothetical protein
MVNTDIMLQQAATSVANIAEGMLQAAEDTLLPAAYEASVTVLNVRTGDYSGGGGAVMTGPASVMLGNDIEYAAPLEYGWTDRGGGPQTSPGVLGPAVYEGMPDFEAELGAWLMGTL